MSVVFLVLFSLFISHIARYAPSSQKENHPKYKLKLKQLIIYTSLNDDDEPPIKCTKSVNVCVHLFVVTTLILSGLWSIKCKSPVVL